MASFDSRAMSFLDARRVAHLASADASGEPHLVPVCFVRAATTIYVAIDQKPKHADPRQLKRVRNVLENPRVSLVADVYDEDWSRLGFVLVHGGARVIDGGEEHRAALFALRAKYEQYRSMSLEDRPMIAIDIQRVTAWGTARAAEDQR
jgi:PPOX class probable F420-dependent enzyme